MDSSINHNEKPEFKLEFVTPYSTFQDGEPKPIPFVSSGLLTQSGFSILAAKPKHGKSSLSRYEAVCVAKGIPFLGRQTVKGEVILISLEDPRNHVDNCLKALGYDPASDAQIRIIEKLPSTADESIEVLGKALAELPDVRLVIVDTMAKLLRVTDLNDYMPVLSKVEQLRNLARRFPQLHIQGLAHCKKAQTDDPFDSLLGSTALRGETDTNIAIYQQSGHRILATETRIGTAIPATIVGAELEEIGGAEVVKDFVLDCRFDEWKAETREKHEIKQRVNYEARIIDYLQECERHTAPQELVLQKVQGKRASLLEAIRSLTGTVLTVTGVSHSPEHPLTLTLNSGELSKYRIGDDSLSELREAMTATGEATSALESINTGGQTQ